MAYQATWPPPTIQPVQNTHQMLQGRMYFIEHKHAQYLEAHHQNEPGMCAVFIGQLGTGFDNSLIAGFVNQLVGKDDAVQNVSTRVDKRGCTWVTIPSECEAKMLQWHKRMLFDVLGVWLAQDDQRMAEMNHYVSTQRKMFPPELPRHTMVVEPIKALLPPPTAATPAQTFKPTSMPSIMPACKAGHILHPLECQDSRCDTCHTNTTGQLAYTCAAVAPMCAKVVCTNCVRKGVCNVPCIFTTMIAYKAPIEVSPAAAGETDKAGRTNAADKECTQDVQLQTHTFHASQ